MSTTDDPLVRWPIEFAKIISCSMCSKATDPNLMRDSDQNVPQPGYIGEGYPRTGLLLVGQNPHVPNPSLDAQDREYTAALRALRDTPTERQYAQLQKTLRRFIPRWPVQNNYFPLKECGLNLEDIAYLNLVRCRTGDGAPNANTVNVCRRAHFEPWLDMLSPACVVFIGVWACGRGGNAVATRGIPYATINRDRSLSGAQRAENRIDVARFVLQNIRLSRVNASVLTCAPPAAYRPVIAEDSAMEMDPKRTIALLDELQKLGFTEEAFCRLHHHHADKRVTIAMHRRYCAKTSVFVADSTNVRVYRRLAFVLKTFRESDNSESFIELADAAIKKIPL